MANRLNIYDLPDAVHVPIWYDNARSTPVSALLPYVNLGEETGTIINNFVFPIRTDIGRTRLPAVRDIAEFWTPWDEILDSSHRIHLIFQDLALFAATIRYVGEDVIDLLPRNCPEDRSSQTWLSITYLPATDTLYCLSVTSRVLADMQMQLAELRAQVRQLANSLGVVRETFAAVHPQVAPLLGLQAPAAPANPPGHAADGRNRRP